MMTSVRVSSSSKLAIIISNSVGAAAMVEATSSAIRQRIAAAVATVAVATVMATAASVTHYSVGGGAPGMQYNNPQQQQQQPYGFVCGVSHTPQQQAMGLHYQQPIHPQGAPQQYDPHPAINYVQGVPQPLVPPHNAYFPNHHPAQGALPQQYYPVPPNIPFPAQPHYYTAHPHGAPQPYPPPYYAQPSPGLPHNGIEPFTGGWQTPSSAVGDGNHQRPMAPHRLNLGSEQLTRHPQEPNHPPHGHYSHNNQQRRGSGSSRRTSQPSQYQEDDGSYSSPDNQSPSFQDHHRNNRSLDQHHWGLESSRRTFHQYQEDNAYYSSPDNRSPPEDAPPNFQDDRSDDRSVDQHHRGLESSRRPRQPSPQSHQHQDASYGPDENESPPNNNNNVSRKPAPVENDDSDVGEDQLGNTGYGRAASRASTPSVSTVNAEEDETPDGDDSIGATDSNDQENQGSTSRPFTRSVLRKAAAAPPPAQPRARSLKNTDLAIFVKQHFDKHIPNNNLDAKVVAQTEKSFERNPLMIDDDEEEPQLGYFTEFTLLVTDENVDGDTLKFALCIQVHGDESPEECRDSIYIECVDSVKLGKVTDLPEGVVLTPHRQTFQELLFAVLEYHRLRLFEFFHLWACPSLDDEEGKGHYDYFFRKKPSSQQIPTEELLIEAYWEMSKEAERRGILLRRPKMYGLHYFTNGELHGKIPVFPGSRVDSILEECGLDKEEVKTGLRPKLEAGINRASLIVGELVKPGRGKSLQRVEEESFGDLLVEWSHFVSSFYVSNPGSGFSSYELAKETTQAMIDLLHEEQDQARKRAQAREDNE